MSNIRIRIPKDVTIEIIVTDQRGEELPAPIVRVWTFSHNFIRRTVFNPGETKWGQSTEWLFAGMEIRGAFANKKAGDIVELSHDQHEKLVSVIKSPTNPYNFEIVSQIKSFFDAVLEPVKDEAPSPKKR